MKIIKKIGFKDIFIVSFFLFTSLTLTIAIVSVFAKYNERKIYNLESEYNLLKYLDEIFMSYRWHDTNTIKNTERMAKLGLKTLQLEEKYAQEHGYGKLWQVVCGKKRVKLFDYKIFSATLMRRKIELKLFGFIKFKIKNNFYINYLDKQAEKQRLRSQPT
ncbi:MAG: hypothetical protein U9O87_10645 [Verrucomicrobiota bacterium]|nr:hypothetical protein [Verrucomicrobiota bacterium]